MSTREGPVQETQYDVVCIGMMVANVPVRPVSKHVFEVDVTLVDPTVVVSGGDAMNQAVVLSRLGAKVLLAAKVGQDRFGDFLLAEATENGVSTRAIRQDSSVHTSTCVVLISDEGRRNFLSNRSATEAFLAEDVELDQLSRASVVSVGSLMALPGMDGPPLARLLEEVRARGCLTVADTKHDTYGLGIEKLRSVLPHLDWMVPSYDEAVYLTGESDPARAAQVLSDFGVSNVVIKLGEEGCYLYQQGMARSIQGFETNPVDTTGAGDNFVAGFIMGLLRGWDAVDCCELANAVGALSVECVGATCGVHSAEQVEEYVRDRQSTREC